MAPPIRARPRLPHSQTLPSGSFHKPIILLHQRVDIRETQLWKPTKLITWIIALSNSVKLWAMPCRATQDGWVMVESSDKMWSTGEGNGKPLQYSCLENPMNSMKRQKDRTLKYAQYATGEKWRNNSRKNEEMDRKQKQHPIVEVTGDGTKSLMLQRAILHRNQAC